MRKHLTVKSLWLPFLLAGLINFWPSETNGATAIDSVQISNRSIGGSFNWGNSLRSPAPLVFDNWHFLKAYTLGLETSFNLDDFLIGASLGLQTTKWNTSLYLGYIFRPKAKTTEIDGPTYPNIYSYKEGRSMVYLHFEKRLGFEVGISKIGIVGGVKEIYSFGIYRNTHEFYTDDFFFAPSIGLFWMNYEGIVKLTYEHLDLGMAEYSTHSPTHAFPTVSPHHICFSFIYCFNTGTRVDF